MKHLEFLKPIIDPFKSAAVLFIIGGFLLVLAGSLFSVQIDQVWFFPNGSADIIVKTGSAVLGAGVFAAIMKSAQFTDVFQRNIHEVFFSPELAVGLDENKRKWRILTDSIFKKCLTNVHGQATQKISDTYFSSELDYHFEDMKVEYRLQLDHSKRYLDVRATSSSRVVISPDTQPIIWQRISTESAKPFMTALIIDQRSYAPQDFFKPDPDTPGEQRLEIPYDIYSQGAGFNETRTITLERTVEYKQDISIDPFIAAGLTRFVIGLEIAIKCINCNYHFTNTGSRIMEDSKPYPSGSNYDTRILAKKGTLLLPGMGYIIVITS